MKRLTTFSTIGARVTLGVSLFASLLFVAQPTKTEAFIVFDPTVASLTTAHAAITATLNAKEYVLDPLAYAVSRVAIHTITKSVVNWINSGFQGSPSFVQDLQGEFLRIADTEATRFINEFTAQSGLDNLPWRDEIAQSVLSDYFLSTSKDGFYLQNPYTLDQVSPDPKAFTEGKYSENGGLKAWNSLIFNVANNPLFYRTAVREQLQLRAGTAKQNRLTELNWSGGFNSFRGKCAQPSSTFLGGTNSGSGVLSLNANVGSNPVQAPAVLTNTDACLGSPILTPGTLIAQSANKFLVDNGLDQFVQADEINEIVGALMGQLVNNVLGSGGLLGTSRPSSGGGRSYVDQLGDAAQTTADSNSLNLSTTFLTTVAKQAQQIQEYQDNWQRISDAAAAAKAAYPNSVCSAQVDAILSQAGSAISLATSALSSIHLMRIKLSLHYHKMKMVLL
jgi:hypothetical protein